MISDFNSIGIVVIGRNEGDRLKKCLPSILKLIDAKNIVYVDSGSDDGSLEYSESLGVLVLELAADRKFTAARARNEGFFELLKHNAGLRYIQFIDGDCQLSDGWLRAAFDYLEKDSECTIACGRRRERFPERSVYNQLCDIEWDTPIGDAKASGGDFLCRVKSFSDVGGFNSTLIAGEEPELCFRIRKRQKTIMRLDAEMTRHDADMTRLAQWTKRCERSGYAYACGMSLHGGAPEYYCVRNVLSILLWAGFLPVFILTISATLGIGTASLIALIYPIKVVHIALQKKSFLGLKLSSIYAISIIGGKFFEIKGILSFWVKSILGSEHRLIEYK